MIKIYVRLIADVKVRNFEVVETSRLSSKTRCEGYNDGKPRPLLVRLTNVYDKWTVIKNAKNLKGATEDLKKKVFIVPDLTIKG